MKRKLLVLSIGLAAGSCAHLSVDPIEVKTIRIEHEVNLHIDQKLEEFFAYQERAATQPTTQQAARGAQ